MRNVLVVDDIETNRKLLRQILGSIEELEVVEAVNGVDAVDLCKSNEFDLILMDINMPDMNGYDAAQKIKSDMKDSYTPIIFVTALSEEVSHAESITSGGDDHVSKPFNIEILKSKIHAHLRIRDLNTDLFEKNNILDRANQKLLQEHDLVDYFFDRSLKHSDLDKNIIDYHMSATSAFNGDALLAKKGPRGGLYILLGDFTGHGLTAAMGTLPTAMIFFEMAHKGLSVSDIASELNRQLNNLLPPSIFFAATLLEMNPRGNVMSVWAGGLPESYLLSKNGDIKQEIHSSHMPLGVLSNEEFDASTVDLQLDAGDRLLLYSDGITEARNQESEMFGNERLRQIINGSEFGVIQTVFDELRQFTSTETYADDTTIVELNCQAITAVAPVEATINACLPWNVSLALTENDMRNTDPVMQIANTLGSIPALIGHKSMIQVILKEIYSNALEHSILQLSSEVKNNDESFSGFYALRQEKLNNLKNASIQFDFSILSENDKLKFKIRATDNGAGYQGSDDASADQPHGRGLTIIQSLCEEVFFFDSGRTIEALYALD